jgi:hypothetical protein
MNTTDVRSTASGVMPLSARSSTVTGWSAFTLSCVIGTSTGGNERPFAAPGSSGPRISCVCAASGDVDPVVNACSYSERDPTAV